MADEATFPDVPGASDLFAWFGYWPTFHEAEILSVHVDRLGPSKVRVHTSERTNDVDSRGYFIARKHVVVTFLLKDIGDLELDDFNHQNVVAGITLAKGPNGYKLEFWPCYGLNGMITAASVRIEVESGMPPNS